MSPRAGDQRQFFTGSLVPELFFANPDGFLDLLSDGGRYLNFLWGRAGEAAGGGESASRVSGELIVLARIYRLGLIRLPEPAADREILYLGLACRPPGLTLKGLQHPAAAIYALEAASQSGVLGQGWVFSEKGRDGSTRTFEKIQAEPEKGSFLAAVRSALDL